MIVIKKINIPLLSPLGIFLDGFRKQKSDGGASTSFAGWTAEWALIYLVPYEGEGGREIDQAQRTSSWHLAHRHSSERDTVGYIVVN